MIIYLQCILKYTRDEKEYTVAKPSYIRMLNDECLMEVRRWSTMIEKIADQKDRMIALVQSKKCLLLVHKKLNRALEAFNQGHGRFPAQNGAGLLVGEDASQLLAGHGRSVDVGNTGRQQ